MKIRADMKILFDVHCHTMSLARPAIGCFVDAFLGGAFIGCGFQSFFSQVAAPGYSPGIFADGPLDRELKRSMISENPARFLFGDAS